MSRFIYQYNYIILLLLLLILFSSKNNENKKFLPDIMPQLHVNPLKQQQQESNCDNNKKCLFLKKK